MRDAWCVVRGGHFVSWHRRKNLRGPRERDLELRVEWSSGVQEAPVTLTMQEPGPAGTFSLLNIFKWSHDWGELHAQSLLQL